MIFADKLIHLREKCGWSQEELAEQMNVSRQSVSKWEGAQSMPDLEKIVRLSKLFGVSTDYLLKDEQGEDESLAVSEDSPAVRRLSLAETQDFLAAKAETTRFIALGVSLCILSPICLLLLAALSEQPGSGISEEMAVGGGMVVLLLIVIAAVALFLYSGSKTSRFEFLDSELFEAEYGVNGLVKEQQEKLRVYYTRNNIIGVILCIASVLPLFMALILNPASDLLMMGSICTLLAIVALAVNLFVRAGIPWASCQKLLQEGDYTPDKKLSNALVAPIYWPLVIAIYLVWSFVSTDWHLTWIVWPIAGVLYPLFILVCHRLIRK